MLYLTLVNDEDNEIIIDELSDLKDYFRSKNIDIGIAESITNNNHFIKIFCDGNKVDDKFKKVFDIYLANIIYKIVVEEFYKSNLQSFLTDTYFFLRYDEIKEVKELSLKALKCEGNINNEDIIYCINRKNKIIDKIAACIRENDEINIKGFITFRMKELKEELECIIDKVVERYMVEKEYDEFIKLLKYFVDIQESKIEEVNIIIKIDGTYLVKDHRGNDITEKLTCDITDSKMNGLVAEDDLLISGLVANSPEKIIIHCAENSINKELLQTIQNVFQERVEFCDSCKLCKSVKSKLKI